MKSMRRLDLIAALVMLALSALVAGATYHLPYWTAVAPGPSFAALWIAGTGALIAIVILIQSMTSKTSVEVDWPDSAGLRQVTLGIAALWLLFFMLPLFGMLISSTVFMLGFLLVIERRPLRPSLITTVVSVGLFELVFRVWLNVQLPRGIFGF